MDYIQKANELWEAYVPESGQAATLQGELLREIEALRTEAQENDNINFDEDYAYFCDFILQTLKGRAVQPLSQALSHCPRLGDHQALRPAGGTV